jgi:glycosyltransferase involved in cell wall biosynthesis
MHITIFTDTYLPKIDGIAISVERFCRLLSEKGHTFTICCPRYPELEDYKGTPSVKVIRFKNASLPSYPDVKIVMPSRKRIRAAFNDPKPDLVHIQTPGLLGQFGINAAKHYGVPVTGTYHTMINEMGTYLNPLRLLKMDKLFSKITEKSKQKKKLQKAERKKPKSLTNKILMKITNSVYERGSCILSPTELIRQELLRTGVKAPVEVVSNGIELDKFKFNPKSGNVESPRLLHVGRLSFEKNVSVVLRAFVQILKTKPKARLSVIGDGPALPALKTEAQKLEIDGNVDFPGFIANSELPGIYPQYDLFVTASTMETQGLVVLEAMACGLPVVGVNSYALPELIQNNVNGFLLEPFDIQGIATKVLQTLDDSALMEDFSKESRKLAESHDVHQCALKLEAIYEKVAGKKY